MTQIYLHAKHKWTQRTDLCFPRRQERLDLLESSASWGFLVAQTIKSLTANAGDPGSIPG